MDNKDVISNPRNNHPLHKQITNIIENIIQDEKYLPYKIIKSSECGGKQKIPLYCSKEKGNGTKYCNVDLLILKDNKIKILIEIEESDIKPIQICGKFLASALSSYYIHKSENNEIIEMGDSVTLIQIIDASTLKKNTSKVEQCINLEKSIQNIIPIKESNIDKYKLFVLNYSQDIGLNEIDIYLKEALN